MDEVEAVARSIDPDGWKAHDKAISSGIPLFTRNAATFVGASLKQARAAIAALDEWRRANPPPLRNASREEAAGWPSLKQAMDYRAGREAGLREAAAVVEKEGKNVGGGCQRAFDPVRLRAGDDPYVRMCLARKELAAAILAALEMTDEP